MARRERPLRQEVTEVHHHRDAGQRTGLDCLVDGSPIRQPIVRALDAHDHVLVFLSQPRHFFGVEVFLLGDVGDHAEAGDVDMRQHARLEPLLVDHGMTEEFEVAPTRAARVHGRGDAGRQRVRIRLHAVIARPRAGDVSRREHMYMQVHEAGRDVKVTDVESSRGLRFVN